LPVIGPARVRYVPEGEAIRVLVLAHDIKPLNQLHHRFVIMSHLKYYAYEGVGVKNRKVFSYSQAVHVGDRIECSGQGEPI
jgi:S-adenosylmethionine hydrolase